MQWEGEELFTPRLTRIAPNDANVFSSPLLTPSFPSAAFCGTLTRGGGDSRETAQASRESSFIFLLNQMEKPLHNSSLLSHSLEQTLSLNGEI